MRLRDLDGEFMKWIDDRSYRRVETLAEADGVMFQCPLCAQSCEAAEEGGRRFVRGAHYVLCWFVGKVPDHATPAPGRWNPSGTSLDDLAFVGPGAASVLLTGPGCGWHGFIRNGEATLN